MKENKAIKVGKKFFGSKRFKYGSNSIIITAIVIAIAVVANMFASMCDYKIDITPEKLYSISDTTKEIISGVDKEVNIYGLFDEAAMSNDNRIKEATRLLEKYESSKIKVKYVDPDKNVTLLNELNPDNTKDIQKGNFVVKCGNKIKVLTVYDLFNIQYNSYGQQSVTGLKAEQAFTGAIKYVTAEVTPTVYFLEGHDEIGISSLSAFKTSLENNNYEVKTINLHTTESVPEDAEIVVAVSPKKDLTASELDKLEDFLKAGGNGVFLFDSLDSAVQLTGFEKILNMYNVGINYDRVKENDSERHIQNQPYDILPDIQSNEINSDFSSSSFYMVMPKSRSINVLKNDIEWITVTPLIKSSSQAVGEQIDTSNGENIPGPVNLAVASEYTGGSVPSKILVFGNASFITDDAISKYQQLSINGMYFFLNSINWMQDAKDDTIIETKNYDTTSVLNMTASQAYRTIAVVLVIIPLVILIYGGFVWRRRRHL